MSDLWALWSDKQVTSVGARLLARKRPCGLDVWWFLDHVLRLRSASRSGQAAILSAVRPTAACEQTKYEARNVKTTSKRRA